MSRHAAITVGRPRDEIERLWHDSEYRPRYVAQAEASVIFKEAPGGRGTEIHVDLEAQGPGGRLGEMVQKLTGTEPLARVKDDLRRFKQHVETGEVPRSDGTPEGETLARKPRPRPAQPMSAEDRQAVGV